MSLSLQQIQFVDGENDLSNNHFGVVVYEVFDGGSTLKDMHVYHLAYSFAISQECECL